MTLSPFSFLILFLCIANPVAVRSLGAGSLPAVMVVISAVVYAIHHDSAHEYSLWSVLPLAASGFLPLVIGIPDRIRPFLPCLFGGIWLMLCGAWSLTRYLDRHRRPQAMEQLSK